MEQAVFSQILWRYAALEHDVQRLIGSRCGAACGRCTSRCCRTDLCEEAFESAFLKRLHGQNRDSTMFSDRYGWLTEHGCGLALGRPPICYEFFCDELLAVQPDATHRYVLQVIGRLVSHIGRDALGHIHLVEITNENEFAGLSLESFKEKLNQARSALEHIRFFYDNRFLEHDAAEQFRPILDPPAELIP